jgi:hypothetical protein
MARAISIQVTKRKRGKVNGAALDPSKGPFLDILNR